MNDFYRRLEKACSDSPDVPPKNAGRQLYIAKKMAVSQEASRKWFAGESIPRVAAMKKLASLLNVPHSWLAVGTSATEQFEIRETAKIQDSGIYAFMSFLLSSDYQVGFTKTQDDPSDITAIKNGEIVKFIVVSSVFDSATRTCKVTPKFVDSTTRLVAAVSVSDKSWSFDFVDVSEIKNTAPYLLSRKNGRYILDGLELKTL